ncbi:hypothetical protein ACFWIA_35015 [Streptomyces sp. NPDC127068]|uniref:hypothetical protein n=1 Tax=Streptomyces sp. NPDC127068 TaxID=3347127 RepID=UPI003659A7C6
MVLEVSPSRSVAVWKAIAYTGAFHLDGDEVVHRITSGTWPYGRGTELHRRAVVLPGRLLRLVPIGKANSVELTLIWRKN